MSTSILLARLIGPVLVVAGLAALVNPKFLQEIASEFLASRALIFIAGFLTLLAGLAIVNTHNVWSGGWPVVITVLGWLMVLGGVLRMGFPALTRSLGETMLARTAMLRVATGLQVALGGFLMYVGYL